MGWSDWKHPHTLSDVYLWSVSICGQGSASERHLFFFLLSPLLHFWDTTAITASSVTSFFLFPFPTSSWPDPGADILIAFTAWRVDIQAILVFGLRRDAAMQPQPRRRPGLRHPFCFLHPFLGWIPVGTRLRWLVIMIPPACVWATHCIHSFCFPYHLVFLSHG